MNRRHLLHWTTLAPLAAAFSACAESQVAKVVDVPGGVLEKSLPQWRSLLSAERYAVLFEDATEPAGSSPLDSQYGGGTYICAACFLPLFDAQHKFDSGTGWPSFTQPIADRLGQRRDYKLIFPRTEYHCLRCDGHQGHVFNDGPPPRGERWCNNGLALLFVREADALPELRV